MIDHDDDSSVESEYISDKGNESVPCLDDISVSSFRGSNFPRNGSTESMFSQSSVEIDLAPLTCGGGGKKNHRFNMVSNVPDAFVQVSDAPSGLRRDNSLSGSCNSIKEQLHFGAINEHADYESLASSDEESSSDDDDDSDVEDKPLPQSKPKKYTPPVFKQYIGAGSDDDTSDAESSVDDNIINTILRKTDSREQMRGAQRTVRTAKYTKRNTKTPGKVKDVTSDPLLNRFFVNRREQGTPQPAAVAKPVKPVASRRPVEQVEQSKERDEVLDSIMNKTDSLIHVSKIGRRVVKTAKKDPRHLEKKTAPRRSSLGCSDELMERFLSSKAKEGPSTSRRSSIGTTDPTLDSGCNKTFTSCDSLNRVQGKGQRVVKTRSSPPP